MRLQRAATILAAAACLNGGLLLPVAPAGAQEPARIAVIDIQRIMRDSIAAEGVRQEIENRRANYQNEIAELEATLREREQELTRQRSIIAPDLFQQRERKFQGEVGELGQLVESRKRQINHAMGDAMQQIQAALSQVVEEVVAERELTLVLPRSQIVFSAEHLEITDVVLERLNERMPSVQIALPEN